MTGLVVLVISGLASAAIVAAVRGIAVRRALLDHPNERSSHAVPKPRLGGIGVVLPVLATGVWLVASGAAPSALLLPLAATGLVSVLGLVDDLRPLPARVRFAVQVALATAVVLGAWERLPAAAGVLGDVLPRPVLAVGAVLWITWLTNLYNFMDGIDGIAGTQAVVAAVALLAVAGAAGGGGAVALLAALAGASAGFLLFNLPPSTIFMGDVGSTAIGFLFGVLPLFPGSGAVTLEPVALALSLFVLDATTTLVRRIARGEKWYTPHRTHLYQRPVVAGEGHRSVLVSAFVGMLVVGACAAAWPAASAAGRLGLLSVPVGLFAGGHWAVGRIERRARGPA